MAEAPVKAKRKTAKAAPAVEADELGEGVKLVACHRAKPDHEGGPLTADVHPLELDNYLAGGWEKV